MNSIDEAVPQEMEATPENFEISKGAAVEVLEGADGHVHAFILVVMTESGVRRMIANEGEAMPDKVGRIFGFLAHVLNEAIDEAINPIKAMVRKLREGGANPFSDVFGSNDDDDDDEGGTLEMPLYN